MPIFFVDAQYHVFGSSYVTHNPPLDPTVNLLGPTDIAILPQSLITVAGRIGSIQFYSSGAGTVNIYVIYLKMHFYQKENLSLFSSYFVGCVHHRRFTAMIQTHVAVASVHILFNVEEMPIQQSTNCVRILTQANVFNSRYIPVDDFSLLLSGQ